MQDGSPAKKKSSPIKVKTPRGYHLWFKHPGFHIPNAAKVKDDKGQSRYDIRGDGGYVLIPNSSVKANGKDIHVTGQYQWRGDLNDLKSIPVFNPEWGQGDPSGTGQSVKNGREYIKHIKAVAGNGGHNETYRAVCKLQESGLSSTEAFAALVDWNETNTDPAWTVKELQHKIESVYEGT